MGRKLLLLSINGALLVTLFALAPGSETRASLPAPAAQSLTTPEGSPVDVTLAATHSDGLPGCTELTFTVANETGGVAGAPAGASCVEGTILAGDVDEAAGTLSVLSTLGFPASGTLRIGDELVAYAGLAGSSFTGVTRGQGGTAAAAHAGGASVLLAELENAPLGENVSDVDAAIIVDGVSLGFPDAGVLQIQDEFITYAAVAEVDTDADTVADGTRFSGAVRGAFDGLAAAHIAGRTAYRAVAVATSLTAAVDGSQTTVPLASTGGLVSAGGLVQVGAELIAYGGVGEAIEQCVSVAAPCLTDATRGAQGTAAAAHGDATAVFQFAQPDLDLAASSFTPGAEYFAVAAALSADVSDTDAILPASAVTPIADAFPPSGTLAVDDEIVAYTGAGGDAIGCAPFDPPCFTGVTRGQGGTRAVAHTAGVDVFQAFFSYTAAHDGASALAVAGVEVTAVNDPPVASDVTETLEPGATLPVALQAQDIDGDSGAVLEGDCEVGFSVGTAPAHGALGPIANDACTSAPPNTDLTPNGDSAWVTYTPEPGYSGADSFVILVCDDDACDDLNVALTVSEPTPTPSPTPEPTPEPTPSPSPTPEPTPSPSPAPSPQFAHGDIDCDGDVDATDALAILRMVAGLPVPPPALAEGCPAG